MNSFIEEKTSILEENTLSSKPADPKKPVALLVGLSSASFEPSRQALIERKFEVLSTQNLDQTWKQLDQGSPSILILSLDYVGNDLLDFISHPNLKQNTEIVLTSSQGDHDRVQQGILAGATYFYCHTSDNVFLLSLFDDIASRHSSNFTAESSPSKNFTLEQFGLLQGSSTPMRNLYRSILRIAPTNANVLLYGESGSGKKYAAKTIHNIGNQRETPLMTLHCPSMPTNRIEVELFGTEAQYNNLCGGLINKSAGGSLLIEEITLVPAHVQNKLLQLIDAQGSIVRENKTSLSRQTRILATTRHKPADALQQGSINKDLYLRLASMAIKIPPLRERGQDIQHLAQHFVNRLNESGKTKKQLSRETAESLEHLQWPGNVRELASVIEGAYIRADHDIYPEHLPPLLAEVNSRGAGLNVEVGESLQSAEQKLVLATLASYSGDKRRAAKTLGVSLKTLYNRLNQYNRPMVKPSEAGRNFDEPKPVLQQLEREI